MYLEDKKNEIYGPAFSFPFTNFFYFEYEYKFINFTGSHFCPKSMSVSSFSNPFFKLTTNYLEMDGTILMNQVCN